jgi:hypothetical protein
MSDNDNNDNNENDSNSKDFNVENLKNPLGIAAVILMLSMFLPWAGPFSGWSAASIARYGSAFAYLIYLVPVGSGIIIYSLLKGDDVPAYARFSGLVPMALLLGMVIKMNETTGGLIGIGDLLQGVVENLGFGYWLAILSGLFVVIKGK